MTVPVLSTLAQGVWMVALWVVLWGDLSLANVVSGIAVTLVLLTLLPLGRGTRGSFHVRPLWALWFLGYFLVKLVQSNLIVAWEIVTPRDRTTTGVVAVPLRDCSDGLVTLIANCITLTPGTLTLEIRREPTTLYVHVLHLRDIDAVRRDIRELERMAVRAFGTPEALAQFRSAEKGTTP